MSYLNSEKKEECCACGACLNVCPKQAIHMEQDSETFLYPVVNQSLCVHCHLCEQVCPLEQPKQLKNAVVDETAVALAASNRETVRNSSSGGAFSLLMDAFVASCAEQPYAVFGAAFDGLEVVCSSALTREDANRFLKSKYVQCDTRMAYAEVKALLEKGYRILFSGTPCMVAGLKAYLRKPYDALTTVDIICHGVPSQQIFNDYIAQMQQQYHQTITGVTFRNKMNFDTEKTNSRTVRLTFETEQAELDIPHCAYLYGFHTGMYFRPSCMSCAFTTPERPADITLGDFWGIEELYPALNTQNGVSMIHYNTPKGKTYAGYIETHSTTYPADYAFAVAHNDQLRQPSNAHRHRERFFKLRKKGVSFCEAVAICKKPATFFEKVIHKLIK